MRLLSHNVRNLAAWAFIWFLAAICSAQQQETTTTGGEKSVYCTNESGTMLCTEDNGKTWHEPGLDDKPQKRESESGAPAPVERPLYRRLIPGFHIGEHDEQEISWPPEPVPEAGSDIQEIVAAVTVNGHPVNDFAHLALDKSGHFYVGSDILIDARLKLPASPTFRLNGRDYFALDSFRGVTYTFDPQKQSLAIFVPASQFSENVLTVFREPRIQPAIPSPGLFFNHDIEFSRASGNSVGSGLLETGFFSKAGVLTSRFVSRDFQDSSQFARLDTQLVTDFPERRMTFTLGDSTSAVNTWGRQVHYAGFRIARKFSTDPGFLPYALPSLRGQAAQPSTIDLYVNNIRTMSQPVDAGPFSIPTIPVMTGMGDIQLVVTDVMGRQQIIDASYINATQLLRKGVSDYTYEAGTLRRSFGLTSNQYNSIFAAGTHRYAVSDRMTLDGRAELLPANQTIGFGTDLGLLPLGLISSGVALSHSSVGGGAFAYLQFQHRARAFGFSGTIQVTSSTFRQLGLAPGERPSHIIAQAQISHALWNHGSLAIGYLHKEDRTFAGAPAPYGYIRTFDAVTPSINFRLGRRAFLSTSLTYSPSIPKGNSATMALVVPLGSRRTVTSMGSVQNSGSATSTEFTQQLPVGTGYGYRIRNTTDTVPRVDAGFSYQNERGNYDVEAAQSQGQTNWRISERSGLIVMQDQVAVSRWLSDSFGLVEAPGVKDVRIYANNQYVTKTNARGFAVIPNLVPYDRNTIRLDDSGMPLDLQMDLAEKTVAPMPRSGVMLKFAAAKIQGALIQLRLPDGSAIPSGAEVRVNSENTIYQVALRGEVFVSSITFPASLHVNWKDQVCVATVSATPTNEPLPKIGPVVCEVK